MSRPAMEVADILRAQGNKFLERYQSSFGYQQLKAFRAILRCRSAALGGHIDVCLKCGHQEGISYNFMSKSHCPKCQAQARERWLEARQQKLLDTGYFHVVFTVPHELNPLALNSPARFYDLLFAASSQTLLEVAADPKRLGAEIGFLSILHSWGSNVLLHPHVHCVVPGGGFSPDRQRWIHTYPRFLLPIPALRRVFRDKFLFVLNRLYSNGSPDCRGPAAAFQDRQRFEELMDRLQNKKWIVYAKPPFGGSAQVLRYLGRYTHRIAISNHRLLAFDGQRVTFRYKDYAHGSKQRIMTLDAVEFLRRFFLHVLPEGFVRIRHFGPLSNRAFRSLVSSPFSTQSLPSTTNNLSLGSPASINIATDSCTKEPLHRSLNLIQYPSSPGRSPRPLRTPAPSFKSPYRNRLEASSSLPMACCARLFRAKLATIRSS